MWNSIDIEIRVGVRVHNRFTMMELSMEERMFYMTRIEVLYITMNMHLLPALFPSAPVIYVFYTLSSAFKSKAWYTVRRLSVGQSWLMLLIAHAWTEVDPSGHRQSLVKTDQPVTSVPYISLVPCWKIKICHLWMDGAIFILHCSCCLLRYFISSITKII